MRKRAAKKVPKRRMDIERPFNGGTWSKARMTTFIKNALRNAAMRWKPKFECIKATFVEEGINPATGHKCKLHRCPECKGLFPQGLMRADHVIPVVGPEGFVDFNTFIERLFVEVDGYRALCKGCHDAVSKAENKGRKLHSNIRDLFPDE